ncbi:SpaH/EbpB family LPXTG-anchored major pilin [Faecalibacterium prausnitzii]|uniref:SpaH/EbpB family LPXTG-anchored major pilin n=1 Tax=Faecalibacterium prausnitzii TaxID=853 RepID=UPI001FA885E7|nr:SpaH/EbpB family LPXTG-anchored major pilin [Faecalibacterium prausnitzii]
MMKKVIKKLLAALLAVAMVCAMAIPAFAFESWETEEDLNKNHDYIAFQIFKGVISKDNPMLSGVDWGQHIIDHDDFLEELRKADRIGPLFANAKSVPDVLAVISTWDDSDDDSIAFARFVCHYLYSKGDPKSSIVGGGGAIKIPEPGYYLIVDNIDFSNGDYYHAYNSFLLVNDTHQGEYNVIINHKVVKPTVEKKVYDNPDGTSTGGFGFSADHAINEKFQFQLIAKLPAGRDEGRAYDYYDKYTVCFNDTLSEGITYDGLDSVVIESNGTPYDITKDSSKYDIDTTDLESQNSFVVKIHDVKTCAEGLDLNDGATITVTYTAHLNDKAYVNTGSSSTENKNSVQLQYSNNPRPGEYWGTTPKSEVYVYTYQLNNTKHAEKEDGTPLPGAVFQLYSDKDCTQEVKLYKVGNIYFPIKDATDKEKDSVQMISGQDGQFNVKGLDAGTYYLKEITPPDGYSACKEIPVTIKADHSRNDQVNLEGSNLTNDIVNIKAGGITLPSTGGIGTTIFYVVGGGLMVAAIVLLVTKKRMENK